jgi:hypothetical protein
MCSGGTTVRIIDNGKNIDEEHALGPEGWQVVGVTT